SQRYPKVLTVSEKEGPFGAGIEEQLGVALAYGGGQDQRQAELRTAQRGSRDFPGTGGHDVIELGRDVRGFARIVVAQIIERYVHNELINGLQLRHRVRLLRRRARRASGVSRWCTPYAGSAADCIPPQSGKLPVTHAGWRTTSMHCTIVLVILCIRQYAIR